MTQKLTKFAESTCAILVGSKILCGILFLWLTPTSTWFLLPIDSWLTPTSTWFLLPIDS